MTQSKILTLIGINLAGFACILGAVAFVFINLYSRYQNPDEISFILLGAVCTSLLFLFSGVVFAIMVVVMRRID